MIKLLLSICISIVILFGCNSKTTTNQKLSEKSGGLLQLGVMEDSLTMYPPMIDDEASKQLAYQIHMGLFQYNPRNLTLGAGICKYWDIDNTGTVYIFNLDSTVYFHDDKCFPEGKGRRVTAQDFKYTFELLATEAESNKNFTSTISRIKGAKEYYFKSSKKEQSPEGIEGIEVIDDFTLKITLDAPFAVFMYNLANPAASVVPKEAIEKYGVNSKVGAGPFLYAHEENASSILLVKNHNFFMFDEKHCKLPYLDSVYFRFVNNQIQSVGMFNTNKLDALLFVRSKQVNPILEQFSDSLSYNLSKSLNSSEVNNSYYNIIDSKVQDLYTNNLRILNLTQVYIQK